MNAADIVGIDNIRANDGVEWLQVFAEVEVSKRLEMVASVRFLNHEFGDVWPVSLEWRGWSH